MSYFPSKEIQVYATYLTGDILRISLDWHALNQILELTEAALLFQTAFPQLFWIWEQMSCNPGTEQLPPPWAGDVLVSFCLSPTSELR